MQPRDKEGLFGVPFFWRWDTSDNVFEGYKSIETTMRYAHVHQRTTDEVFKTVGRFHEVDQSNSSISEGYSAKNVGPTGGTISPKMTQIAASANC